MTYLSQGKVAVRLIHRDAVFAKNMLCALEKIRRVFPLLPLDRDMREHVIAACCFNLPLIQGKDPRGAIEYIRCFLQPPLGVSRLAEQIAAVSSVLALAVLLVDHGCHGREIDCLVKLSSIASQLGQAIITVGAFDSPIVGGLEQAHGTLKGAGGLLGRSAPKLRQSQQGKGTGSAQR